MELHMIVNPAGASGKTRKVWDRVERVLEEEGAEYKVHYSSREHGIADICAEIEESASQGEKTAIITVGGDGSVNEAMNGIRDPEKVLFGHIPAGSGNDLVRDMDLPKDPEQVVRRILEGKVRRTFDIGELTYTDTGETRRFAVSCGIGFDAGICEMAGRWKYKNFLNRIGLGKLIYIFSAFRIVSGQKSGAVDILLDGKENVHYDHLLLLACMNHRYEGGGFQFSPKAAYDDGILDLCIADPKKNSAFYKAFLFVPSGRHYRFDYIHAHRAGTIEIRTQIPLWVHTDGEVERMADGICIRTLPKKLDVIV